MRNRCTSMFLALLLVWAPTRTAKADPCGMVPPIWKGHGSPIVRVGEQVTYVFYKDGVETFVIRPGFAGQVDQFGMLIPFPSPPAIRKVPETIFDHVKASANPPEVLVNLNEGFFRACESADMSASPLAALRKKGVTVLSEEAIGMYEVAVLEAGSPDALRRWMESHGYRYPDGMDKTCHDYIDEGWCFVAVKARVGRKEGVDAVPGMRSLDPNLEQGQTFEGHVQAMGFRFKVDELVLPMRLSAFNEGSLNNTIYLLSDQPCKIDDLPVTLVACQVDGETLYRNLKMPLPLRVIGGDEDDIPDWRKQGLDAERDPRRVMSQAIELYASDLLAARTGDLIHPFESLEKTYLNISEELGMRGNEIDAIIEDQIRSQRGWAVENALEDLRSMTLTVFTGDLPRAHLAANNLTFSPYSMPKQENKPSRIRQGTLLPGSSLMSVTWVSGFFLLMIAAYLLRRQRLGTWLLILLISLSFFSPTSLNAQDLATDLAKLDHPSEARGAAMALAAYGDEAVAFLLGEAMESQSLTRRGWALVALSHFEDSSARIRILGLAQDSSQPNLVRAWASATCIAMSSSGEDLVEFVKIQGFREEWARPLGQRAQSLLGESQSLTSILELSAHAYSLGSYINDGIMAFGARPLVHAMTKTENDIVRRQAAAFLASLGESSSKEIASQVNDSYRFSTELKEVPWDGGALFIPLIPWDNESARELTTSLFKWLIWSEQRNRDDLFQQIHNNLRSLQLAQLAGYTSPGWNQVGIEEWLLQWGRSYGKEILEGVLLEQRVAHSKPYKQVLEML